MRHRAAVEWENHLQAIFDEIDVLLEKKYGDKYPLHPARPRHGSTSRRSQDGLFNVGASFSAGYGSEYGRGYVVDVRMVTLSHVPEDIRDRIENEVVEMLMKKLDIEFPNRTLEVKRDRNNFKIVGDLTLGKA